MSYLITVPKAMQEFDGIREAQLLDIINHEWAAPHDAQGYLLTPEKFRALAWKETDSAVRSLQNELSTSLRSGFGWGGESSRNRQIRLMYQGHIEEAKKYTPQEVLHSMSFIRKELEKAIQEHYPDIFAIYQERTQLYVLPAENDSQQRIQAWEDILCELRGADLIAAQLAIEKLSGKTHLQAFKIVCPNKRPELAKRYVSEKRKLAESLSRQYDLPMPPWKAE